LTVATQFFEQYKQDHLEEHGPDIIRLSTIRDSIHMSDNELIVNFRNNKYGVKMCKYSFELLLSFLQDNKYMLILRLMNQYITIQATSDKPGQMSEDQSASGTGLIGTDASLSAFNSTPLSLGPQIQDKEFYGDIERALGTMVLSR
jgi:transcription initiation factor TFIID subunit 5